MAYDPTIPALENYIGDDIPKIMANFAELAGSRIVDHNLDVDDPPNGYYIRWENGLQICMRRIPDFDFNDTSGNRNYPLPADLPHLVRGAGAAIFWNNSLQQWRALSNLAVMVYVDALALRGMGPR